MYNYNCRVCGLLQESLPWGEDEITPSFEICVCCGTEFGNDDATISAVYRSRDIWLKNGAQWFMRKFKPVFWNLEEQLNHIPLLYR
jgi:hypothetical protein